MLNLLRHLLSPERAWAAKAKGSPALSADLKTEADLVALARNSGFTYFNNYLAEKSVKERAFASAVAHFGIELTGRVVLDVGPGTGDSLTVARSMGARATWAVDTEPYFIRLALMRGHAAWLRDYRIKRYNDYFPAEIVGVDFIWCKGALDCSAVNARRLPSLGMALSYRQGFCFARWICELKSRLAPDGLFIFIPAVARRQTAIVDPSYPITTFHWIDDVAQWDRSWFAQCLRSQGFTPAKDIPHVTHPLAFPTAWVYRNPSK